MTPSASKTRILFVDDEPKILQGLKRMLHSMRRHWDIGFAASGQEALNILSKKSFDVILTDLRMPNMDGSQLLAEVKKRFPNVVRIVLSGQSSPDQILRSIAPSHQYLAKPCDTESLKVTIARAFELRGLLNSDTLRRLVSSITSLPNLPSLYQELVEALRSPDVSTQMIGKIVGNDIGMTTKILQLINSAYFGLPQRITSPTQAVNLLGLSVVKALVVSIKLFSQLNQANVSGFCVERLWRHSMNVGVFAQRIAKAECQEQSIADEAFTAGLLHDVGKLVLASNIPEKYSHALKLANDRLLPHFKAEQEILGATHAEVGAYLLGLWGLPHTIVEAVAYSHPHRCPEKELIPSEAAAVGGVALHALMHVADIFEHRQHRGRNGGKTPELEYDYLIGIGVADRIPEWRRICSETSKNRLLDMRNGSPLG